MNGALHIYLYFYIIHTLFAYYVFFKVRSVMTFTESIPHYTVQSQLSRCSVSISCGKLAVATQWLSLTVALTFVEKPTLPVEVILCLQLLYNR